MKATEEKLREFQKMAALKCDFMNRIKRNELKKNTSNKLHYSYYSYTRKSIMFNTWVKLVKIVSMMSVVLVKITALQFRFI